jgi:hypothetical protein
MEIAGGKCSVQSESPIVLEVEPANPDQVQKVEFFTDQFTRSIEQPMDKVVTSAPFRYVITNLVSARHRWAARVTDRSGNVSQSEVEFHVTPAYDAFANRLALSAEDSVRLEIAGLTREPLEPAPADAQLKGSAWFSWTAPEDGLVSGEWVQDSWPANVWFGVFRGTNLTTLVPIEGAASTNGFFAAPVRRGEQIAISLNVAPAAASVGIEGTADLGFVPALTNTSYPARTLLEGSPVTASSHNVDPATFANGQGAWPVVWWKWIAPASGIVRLSRPEWSRNHAISAFRGSNPEALEQLAGLGAELRETSFAATAGEEILVTGRPLGQAPPGRFEFTLEMLPIAANSRFEQRAEIAGNSRSLAIPFTVPGPREASALADLQAYVSWWEWTAPSSGRVGILGGFQREKVHVYTGEGPLVPVAPAVSQPWPGRIYIDVNAGQKYQIALSWPDLQNFQWYSLGQSWRLAYVEENDAFAKSVPLSGSSVAWEIPNSLGTREADETFVAEGTLWFRWTAPADGEVTFESDPLNTPSGGGLSGAVFRGMVESNLTAVMPLNYLTIHPKFLAKAGVEYQLMVAGGLNELAFLPGTLRLKLSGPPAHDAYAGRIRINRAHHNLTGANTATRSPGDPVLAGSYTNTGTLWWSWTAPTDGLLQLGVSSGALGICREGPNGGLVLEANVTPEFKRAVRAGETLDLMLAGTDQSSAYIALLPLNANDSFANRTQLVAVRDWEEINGYTFGATREAGENLTVTNVDGRSRWWTFKVAIPSLAVVQIATGNLNVYFEQFRWDGSGEMETLAWAQNTNGGARMSFHAMPGVEYPFVVDTIGSPEGEYSVTVRLEADPLFPRNDYFANAANISDSVLTVNGSLRTGTAETDEPGHAGAPASRSFWWRWTAPDSGPVRVSAKIAPNESSDYPTIHRIAADPARPRLVAYTGGTLATINPIGAGGANATNEPQTDLEFQAVEGAAYYLVLDTGSTDSSMLDNFTLMLAQGSSNDAFENRKILTGALDHMDGTIYDATRAADEWSPLDTNAMNVWYEWTAPEDLTVAIRGPANSPITWAVWPASRSRSLPPTASTGFLARAGETYYIAVYGHRTFTDPIDLELEGLRVPPNDDFANRIAVTGERVRVGERAELASREANEPPHALGVFTPSGARIDAPSLWWTWTAPRSGALLITAARQHELTIPDDPRFELAPAEIFVYRGDSIESLVRVAESTPGQSGFQVESATLIAEAGVTYQIAICPLIEAQTVFPNKKYLVHLSIDPMLPNDREQTALELSGAEAGFSGNLREAPDGLWWRWTAPCDCVVALQLQMQSGMLEKAAVEILRSFGGAEALSHVQTVVADPHGQISTSIETVAGSTYYFHVRRHFHFSDELSMIAGQDHSFSGG